MAKWNTLKIIFGWCVYSLMGISYLEFCRSTILTFGKFMQSTGLSFHQSLLLLSTPPLNLFFSVISIINPFKRFKIEQLYWVKFMGKIGTNAKLMFFYPFLEVNGTTSIVMAI